MSRENEEINMEITREKEDKGFMRKAITLAKKAAAKKPAAKKAPAKKPAAKKTAKK